MGKTLNFYTDPCLCGSGKILKDCCLTRRADTKPKGPKTGLSHPDCYARSLGDCSQKISREHFLTDSLLKLYSDAGLGIAVGVPSINRGAPKRLNIRKIRPKVLCERHNNCLSGIDSIGLQFFSFLLQRSPQPKSLMINGYELERWFLKVLCGTAAAGFVAESGRILKGWLPPREWVEILFGDSVVPEDCGLHFLTNITATATMGRIWLQPQFFLGPPKELAAIAFVLDHFSFLLTMRNFPPSHRTRYRPAVFQIERLSDVREVHFGWRNDVLVGARIRPLPANNPLKEHFHEFKRGNYELGTIKFSLPLHVLSRGVRKSKKGDIVTNGFWRADIGDTPCAGVFTDRNLARRHADSMKTSGVTETNFDCLELENVHTALAALAMFRRNGVDFVAFDPPLEPGNTRAPIHLSRIAAALLLPLSIMARNLCEKVDGTGLTFDGLAMVNCGETPCVAIFQSPDAANSFAEKTATSVNGTIGLARIETQESLCEWLRLLAACGNNLVALDPHEAGQGTPLEVSELIGMLEPAFS
jgi:SEC-C motif